MICDLSSHVTFRRTRNRLLRCPRSLGRVKRPWAERRATTRWTNRDRRLASGSWRPRERSPSSRTRPPRAPTASRSTSPRPRRGSETHREHAQGLRRHTHNTTSCFCLLTAMFNKRRWRNRRSANRTLFFGLPRKTSQRILIVAINIIIIDMIIKIELLLIMIIVLTSIRLF